MGGTVGEGGWGRKEEREGERTTIINIRKGRSEITIDISDVQNIINTMIIFTLAPLRAKLPFSLPKPDRQGSDNYALWLSLIIDLHKLETYILFQNLNN